MDRIRRAGVIAAVAAVAALVTVSASACGAASTTTNGLEHKPAAQVVRAPAAALKGAPSVHVVVAGPGLSADLHVQHGSSSGTFTKNGSRVDVVVIGSQGYIKTGQAGLQQFGLIASVLRSAAGRWLKIPAADLTGVSLASILFELTSQSVRATIRGIIAKLAESRPVMSSPQAAIYASSSGAGPGIAVYGARLSPAAAKLTGPGGDSRIARYLVSISRITKVQPFPAGPHGGTLVCGQDNQGGFACGWADQVTAGAVLYVGGDASSVSDAASKPTRSGPSSSPKVAGKAPGTGLPL